MRLVRLNKFKIFSYKIVRKYKFIMIQVMLIQKQRTSFSIIRNNYLLIESKYVNQQKNTFEKQNKQYQVIILKKSY